jgi:hypothetical protein
MDSHYRADEMELGGGLWAMSSGTGKDFDHYARDCVKLAEQPNTPSELREQLLQMAREWMQAYGRGGWYVYFRRRPRFEDAFTAFAIISASFRPKLLASIGAGASLSWPAIS